MPDNTHQSPGEGQDLPHLAEASSQFSAKVHLTL